MLLQAFRDLAELNSRQSWFRQPDCAGSGHSGDHIRIIDQDYHREHHRRADRDYYLSFDLSSQEIEKPQAGNSCLRLFAYV